MFWLRSGATNGKFSPLPGRPADKGLVALGLWLGSQAAPDVGLATPEKERKWREIAKGPGPQICQQALAFGAKDSSVLK